MKLRMLVGLSGPAFTLDPGDERDFDRDEALRLIVAGYATPADQIEQAVAVTDIEKRPRGRPRKAR